VVTFEPHMAGLKLERFARAIAIHDAACAGKLVPTEWDVRPMQDATIALACERCGELFREQFNLVELAGDRAQLERLFAQVQRHAIN
jgi:hypothetical protein